MGTVVLLGVILISEGGALRIHLRRDTYSELWSVPTCCLLLACGCGCRCRLWSHVSGFVLCPLVSYIAHSPLCCAAIRKHIQPHALVASYQQCYRCCCCGLCISFLFSQAQAIIRSKPMIADARWASAAVMATSATQPTVVLRPTQLVGLGSGNN